MTQNPDPVIDIMAINAVKSLFHEPPFDPWGLEIASKMVDLIIYNDRVRYPIVRPKSLKVGDEHKATPWLLNSIKQNEAAAINEVAYYIDDYLEYNPNELEPTFDAFRAYSLVNLKRVRQYIVSRRADWIRPQYTVRLPKHYVFPVEPLKERREFKVLQREMNVDADELVYAFDLVLRYTLYGGTSAEGAFYLSHPLREDVDVPTLQRSPSPLPAVPLSLGPSFVKMIKNLRKDEFAALLHEARGLVRELHIDKLKPGTVSTEARRELAAKLALPARMKGFSDAAVGAIAGLTAVGTAIPFFEDQNTTTGLIATGGTIVGGAILAASSLWKVQLPRWASTPWFQWAVNYDLEKEDSTGNITGR